MKRGPQKKAFRQNLLEAFQKGQPIGRLAKLAPDQGTVMIQGRKGRAYLTRLVPTLDANVFANPKVSKVQGIVRYLQRRGIWIPRLTAIDPTNQILQFESGGRSLRHFLHREPPTTPQGLRQWNTRRLRIILKAAKLLGKVHAAQIVHGHPLKGNFIVQGTRVGITDFKYSAAVPSKVWSKPESILREFKRDYECIVSIPQEVLTSPGITAEKRAHFFIRFFTALVRHYPCSEIVKKALAQELVQKYGTIPAPQPEA